MPDQTPYQPPDQTHAPHSRYWSDHTSEALARMDRGRLIAVLPVAATEQHGPHMPIATDAAIIDGVVRAAIP